MKNQFINAIRDMLLTHKATVVDLTDNKSKPTRGHIGFADDTFYYLLPETSYAAVCKYYMEMDDLYPLSSVMLRVQLIAEGLVIAGTEHRKATRVKQIDGKRMRVLWIPREYIDDERIECADEINEWVIKE